MLFTKCRGATLQALIISSVLSAASVAAVTICLASGATLIDQGRGGQDDALGQTADVRRLVWADEFDANGRPDARNWTFETGFVRNQELQWYQPENAWCEAGLLIIEARRERRKNPDYQAGLERRRSVFDQLSRALRS